MVEFEQLSIADRDDHIAQAIHARELEWFHYEVDRKNFLAMLEALPPGDERIVQYQKRVRDTETQQDVVKRVLDALRQQIRCPNGHAEAVERCRERREAERLARLTAPARG